MIANRVQDNVQEDTLLTVEDLARLLRKSPRTIHRYISSGEILEPYRVGGSPRWIRSELIDWLKQGSQQ